MHKNTLEASEHVSEPTRHWSRLAEHYARLLNVDFEWPSDLLPEVAPA